MRLISITTENYRTLQDLTLRFSPNYCTISGRNNAGKSCVIRLLSALFGSVTSRVPWATPPVGLDYDEDRTQWIKQSAPIKVTYELLLTKDDDPALVSFIEKIAERTITNPSVHLSISYSLTSSSDADTLAGLLGRWQLILAQLMPKRQRRLKNGSRILTNRE
jgi:putative ATP-dependent endonuclease of OLD family